MTVTMPRLHRVDTGNPAGPPTLFVHGFLSSNLQWTPNLPRLGRDLRAILVEQPGHGGSPDPEPGDCAPGAMIAALESIRVELGVERWWLVGHSMGGAICVRYALAHPDRVHGLVFTNSRAVFGVEDETREPPPGVDPVDAMAARLTARGLRALPFHPAHATRIPSDLHDRMVAAADSMSPLAVARVATHAVEWRSRDELHRLVVPTMLVNGTWERRFQPWVPVAEASIRDLTVVNLEGGHSINIEQAEAFDAAVLDFVHRGSAT